MYTVRSSAKSTLLDDYDEFGNFTGVVSDSIVDGKVSQDGFVPPIVVRSEGRSFAGFDPEKLTADANYVTPDSQSFSLDGPYTHRFSVRDSPSPE